MKLVKKSSSPKAKLRQFHWSKVRAASTAATVWGTVSAQNSSVDLSKLEAQFTIQPNKKEKAAVAKKKSTVVHIVDMRRSHKISIELGGIRVPFPDIKAALLAMDESVLTLERLHVLSRAVPTTEELKKLQAYDGDKALLGSVEQYFLEVGPIPRLARRIRALIFCASFEASLQRLNGELETLSSASNQLHSSRNFKALLEAVLTVGNHLNGGSFRGSATGFKIGDLLKLGDVRGNNRVSLLDFVVRDLAPKHPSMQFLCDELKSTGPASRLQMASLDAARRELTDGVAMVKDEILHAAVDMDDSSDKHDRLRDVLIKFVEEKEGPLAELVTAHTQAVEAAANVVIFFGEEPNSDPVAFFKTVSSFLGVFQKAVQAMLQEIERQKSSERQTRQRARSKSMVTVTCPLKSADSVPDLKKVGDATKGSSEEEKGNGIVSSDDDMASIPPPEMKTEASEGPENSGGGGSDEVAGTDAAAAAEAAQEEEDARLVKHLRQAIDARPWIRSAQ